MSPTLTFVLSSPQNPVSWFHHLSAILYSVHAPYCRSSGVPIQKPLSTMSRFPSPSRSATSNPSLLLEYPAECWNVMVFTLVQDVGEFCKKTEAVSGVRDTTSSFPSLFISAIIKSFETPLSVPI